jgi:ribonuclease HII
MSTPPPPRTPVPGFRHERRYRTAGNRVAGVDEVGRGAWAGPVTVAAVILDDEPPIPGLRDSKALAPATRERLAEHIHTRAIAVGVGEASNREIDAVGLTAALRLAGMRAVAVLAPSADVLLIDGDRDFLADAGTQNEVIVRGDAVSASIAAASIVAKVHRDARMRRFAEDHPAYDLASNKGYGAPRHAAALEAHGPCALHRHTWAPVASRRQLRLAVPQEP